MYLDLYVYFRLYINIRWIEGPNSSIMTYPDRFGYRSCSYSWLESQAGHSGTDGLQDLESQGEVGVVG